MERKGFPFLVMVAIVLMFVWMLSLEPAHAEWVLCNPESYVVVRESPSKHADVVGYVYCGDEVELEGHHRNGYARLIISNEINDGWVSESYIVGAEVESCSDTVRTVKRNVRARACVDGKVVKTLRLGSEVRLIAKSIDWCLTDVGYIRSDCLGLD